ncbi:uncharacterized protein LOC133180960 isoform X2 [Saccostrea echinata]|nr:uncharacterized protein LOC133180960 isoform X2 [Saccostrea echinata]
MCAINVSKCFRYFFMYSLTTIIVMLTYSIGMKECPTPSKDYLHFTKNLTDLDNVRARQYISLDCCASGFNTITWFFKNNNTQNSWIPFPFLYQECDVTTYCPQLSPRNQTLHILKATVNFDEGTYLCVAHNSSTGKNISHKEDLFVYDCIDREKPLSIPPHNVLTNTGQNATFQCAADFGCKPSYERDVNWYIGITNVHDIDKRYIVTKDNRDFRSVVQANLTILNVQQKDFDQTFSCWIESDYDIATPKFFVKLQKKYVQVNVTIILVIVLPCLFFIVIITTSTKVVHHAYGPQIKFYFRSRGLLGGLPKMGKKHDLHALIVHDDTRKEDNIIAEEITSRLRKEGYKITQIEGYGEGVFSHFGCNLERSAAVIIIDMENNSEDSNKFRVFIESSLRNMTESLTGFTIIQQRGLENSLMDSVEYKGLKRLQWPGENCTEIQKQRFFKRLQLRLPKPFCHGKLEETTPLLTPPI